MKNIREPEVLSRTVKLGHVKESNLVLLKFAHRSVDFSLYILKIVLVSEGQTAETQWFDLLAQNSVGRVGSQWYFQLLNQVIPVSKWAQVLLNKSAWKRAQILYKYVKVDVSLNYLILIKYVKVKISSNFIQMSKQHET